MRPNPNGGHPIKDILELCTKNSTYQSNKLRIRLLRDRIKKYKCEVCNRVKWNSKPIPLELNHIDGDRTNNSLNNLQIICPNCHAQTKAYRGRNAYKYIGRVSK